MKILHVRDQYRKIFYFTSCYTALKSYIYSGNTYLSKCVASDIYIISEVGKQKGIVE